MTTPLDGVRVIELTTMITGPLAGMLLADLGASVIKIENPDQGDPFRSFRGGLYGGHFLSYNRNKRSLALDLRSPQGIRVLLALIRRSDVLIDNYRPGVLERFGLSNERLGRENPRLIHASITGFGADGPYRNRPAYDAVAQALSGMSAQFLDPQNPQVLGPTLSDNITGFYAAYAILGALFERQRTGKGRRIETSMLEATIAFTPDAFVNFKRYGTKVMPATRAGVSQSYAFRCRDDRLIAVHLSSQPKFWEGILAALGRQELATDARFSTREQRIENYAELGAELAKTFALRSREDWARLLEAADVPFAPVLDVEEVLADPQVQHMGTFYCVRHPREGDVWGIHPPFLLDGERPGRRSPPPTLGEHSQEILRELGFDEPDTSGSSGKNVQAAD
ncbi:MAG: CoA transferase [Hyphomicrobiales bacterium]|nr:CoA transferase [Hyphomicrobiales bacterium]